MEDTSKACLDEQELLWYAARALSDADLARISKHVSDCRRCRDFVQETQTIGEAFLALPRRPNHPEPAVLAALADGTFVGTDARDHLSGCRECQQIVTVVRNVNQDLAEKDVPATVRGFWAPLVEWWSRSASSPWLKAAPAYLVALLLVYPAYRGTFGAAETQDRPLLLAVLALALFGMLMVYSAGQTDVPTVARNAWQRQLAWIGLAFVAGAVVFRVNFRLLEWAAPGVYGLGLLVLLLLLFVGTGSGTAAASKSWLTIGGYRLGQPVELAKLGTILMLARYLSSRREPPRTLRSLIQPCLLVAVPILLVMAQPDLGSAIVFGGILFAMLFWAGVSPRLLLLLASPLISLLLAGSTGWWGAWMVVLFLLLVLWRAYVAEGVFIYVVNSAMGVLAIVLWNQLKDYQRQRLITFLNPHSDPVHAGYQAIQSKVAVGSGGLLGNGYLNGPQKRLAFLPEQYTDFIFAVVGEELGFAGVMLALGLFLSLFFVMLRIARRATDPFSSLVVFGVLGVLFTHLFENVGMTINLMPITGIPLPFFSYGGSFVLAMGIGLGLVFRVAWDSRLAGYAEP